MDRVYVEITNICNLACSFCPGTRRAPRYMTPADFSTVCDRIAPHTKEIFLHLMGEPLLHPDLDTLFEIAADHQLTVSITTNGTLLKKRGEILLKHAEIIKKVSISLHSGEANSQNLQNGTHLSEAIEFAKSAAKHGIFSILRLWNLDSAERKGENADNDLILTYLHEEYPDPWQRRHSGWHIGERTFLECAEIFTWPIESEAEPMEAGRCYGLVRQIGILADGTVVPCCLDSEGKMPLGNVFENTLDNILSGERAVRMRQGFLSGKMNEPLCRRCTYARRFTQ